MITEEILQAEKIRMLELANIPRIQRVDRTY
jgi:hypothetical protein